MSIVFLESPSFDPSFNLALEQYVFEEMPKEKEYFMLWQNENAIVVGKNQNTAEEINAEYVRENHVRVVRRLSGGGAVYHDLGNINFTFVMNAGETEELNLRVFGATVVGALKNLGVIAELNGRNDITVEGKKFSGNAQYIKNGRILHHGTILFDSDLEKISAALKVSKDKIESKGLKSVRSRVVNLREYLPDNYTLAEFKKTFKEYLFEEVECQYIFTEADLERVREIQRERYDMWEWNYGMSHKYRISKERYIESCGNIQLGLEVEEGIITRFISHGDYFGPRESSDLAQILIGRKLKEEDLVQALQGVNIDDYYKNLKKEEFIKILLQ